MASAALSEVRAFRKSVGTLCTTPGEIVLLIFLFYQTAAGELTAGLTRRWRRTLTYMQRKLVNKFLALLLITVLAACQGIRETLQPNLKLWKNK